MFECPHCGEKTISIKDKLLLGYWMTRTCKNCHARISARPIPLALIYCVYTWNVLWFITMYVYTVTVTNKPDVSYLIYMVIGWMVLDIINIGLIPMGVMKKKL